MECFSDFNNDSCSFNVYVWDLFYWNFTKMKKILNKTELIKELNEMAEYPILYDKSVILNSHEELRKERANFKWFLQDIYLKCDALQPCFDEDINSIWKSAGIALGIDFSDEK